MVVVSARVHDADVLPVDLRSDRRAEGKVDFFGDREGVHVGTERDDGAWQTTFEHADDSRAANASADLDAQLAQVLGDERRGARLLPRQLRMRVYVTSPGDDAIVHGQCAPVDLSVERSIVRPGQLVQ